MRTARALGRKPKNVVGARPVSRHARCASCLPIIPHSIPPMACETRQATDHKPVPAKKKKTRKRSLFNCNCISPESPGRRLIEETEFSFLLERASSEGASLDSHPLHHRVLNPTFALHPYPHSSTLTPPATSTHSRTYRCWLPYITVCCAQPNFRPPPVPTQFNLRLPPIPAQVENVKPGANAASVISCSTEGETPPRSEAQSREARAGRSAARANGARVGHCLPDSYRGGNGISGNNVRDAPMVVLDGHGQPSAMLVPPPPRNRRPAQPRVSGPQALGKALSQSLPSRTKGAVAVGSDAVGRAAARPSTGDCAGADLLVGSTCVAWMGQGDSKGHVDPARSG
jgi:hypothetical protein